MSAFTLGQRLAIADAEHRAGTRLTVTVPAGAVDRLLRLAEDTAGQLATAVSDGDFADATERLRGSTFGLASLLVPDDLDDADTRRVGDAIATAALDVVSGLGARRESDGALVVTA